MEMSLDEIIKQNKGSRRGGRGAKRGAGGRFSSSPSRRGSSRGRRPTGGVARGRGRGGIARNRSFGRSRDSIKAAFLGSSPTRKYESESAKLVVSNLDFGVTDTDILELFGEFGPLKKAGVHYDRSGRSLGTADLIYERRADAIKAMKQYNGVPLDGRAMNIQLATSQILGTGRDRRPNNTFRSSSRGSFSNNRRGGSTRGSSTGRGRGNTRGRGGAKRGGRENKKPPTAEELDAELEEYVKSKISSSEGA